MLLRSMVTFAAAISLSTGLAMAVPAVAADSSQPPVTVTAAPGLEGARALASAGKFAEAAALLESYVGTHPNDFDAVQYLGDLYVRLGKLKTAERTYSLIVSARPQDKTAHERLGNAYAADDLLPEAIAQYQQSLPDVVAYTDLVRLHRRTGDLARFVADNAALAEKAPSDASAQLGYGVILRELHRTAEAASVLQRAVALSPRSCAAHTELGNADLDLHRIADASAEYKDCLALDPSDYSALVDLSLTYDPVADADEARALLDRAIALKPNRPEALVDYGYLADLNRGGESGITYYSRALAADVLARDAYVDLGYDYTQQRMFDLAQEVLLKGLSVSPSDGRIEYLLGDTYSQQGKSALAKAEFAAAATSDEPEVSVAALHRLESAN
jgi:tetratricopeptide (TPR) repeat protein